MFPDESLIKPIAPNKSLFESTLIYSIDTVLIKLAKYQ